MLSKEGHRTAHLWLHHRRKTNQQKVCRRNAQFLYYTLPPGGSQGALALFSLFLRIETDRVSLQDPNMSDSVAGKKVKMGACDIAAAAAADDDFDTLISAVKKADSVCSFVKCKASVLTLGQLCLHCNRQYCLSHHIPEVRHEHFQQQPLTDP